MKAFLSFLLLAGISFSSLGADTLFQKGVQNLAQGDFIKAQSYFKEEVKKEPSFSSYYNLGAASGFLEDWNLARWAFESALKYEPNNENAQYNAKLATQQLNKSVVWEHPYSWSQRLLINMNSSLLVASALFLSIFLGVIFYFIITGFKNDSFIKKWSYQIAFLGFLFLGAILFALVYKNQHFKSSKFALLKEESVSFFISPNGVKTNDLVPLTERLEIIGYSKDFAWIQVKLPNENQLWTETTSLLVY